MFKNYINYLVYILTSFMLTYSPLIKAMDEDSRLWQAFIAEGNITKDLRWYAEVQARWKDDVKNFDQGFLRPALNFALSDALFVIFPKPKSVNGSGSNPLL